jgi:hypothetical protein
MRDQSYIAGVGRAIEQVGRELVGEKLIPQGRKLGADETVRLDERSDREDKMVREARNQGVELMLLPKGMSKRLKNSTRWDMKYVSLSLSLCRLRSSSADTTRMRRRLQETTTRVDGRSLIPS